MDERKRMGAPVGARGRLYAWYRDRIRAFCFLEGARSRRNVSVSDEHLKEREGCVQRPSKGAFGDNDAPNGQKHRSFHPRSASPAIHLYSFIYFYLCLFFFLFSNNWFLENIPDILFKWRMHRRLMTIRMGKRLYMVRRLMSRARLLFNDRRIHIFHYHI